MTVEPIYRPSFQAARAENRMAEIVMQIKAQPADAPIL